jgi:hypothetical protein
MKSLIFSTAALLLTLVSAASLQAQGIDPTPPPSTVPIDGGVGFLLAAGAAYGAKKINDYRKAKNS